MQLALLMYFFLGLFKLATPGLPSQLLANSVDRTRFYLQTKELGFAFMDSKAIDYAQARKKPWLIKSVILDYDLKELPIYLLEFPNLEYLEVNNYSQIKDLPEHLSRIKKLRILNLDLCTKLKRVPLVVCKLKYLQELNISKCDLTELPEEIGQMSGLKVLYMINNPRLKNLPESFGKLSKMEQLHMFGTGIRKLPKSFSQLKKLKRVYVHSDLKVEILKMLPHMQPETLKNSNNPNISWVR